MMNIDNLNLSDETAAAYIERLESDLKHAPGMASAFRIMYEIAQLDDKTGEYRIPFALVEGMAAAVRRYEQG